MLKVERLNIESPMERSTVLHPEIRHHYQDYLNDDNENNDDEDYHMAVQSKWTISHLLGLKAIESANSIPCIGYHCHDDQSILDNLLIREIRIIHTNVL